MMRIQKRLLAKCQIIMQTYFKSRFVKCHNMMQIYKSLSDKYQIIMQIYIFLKALLVKCHIVVMLNIFDKVIS